MGCCTICLFALGCVEENRTVRSEKEIWQSLKSTLNAWLKSYSDVEKCALVVVVCEKARACEQWRWGTGGTLGNYFHSLRYWIKERLPGIMRVSKLHTLRWKINVLTGVCMKRKIGWVFWENLFWLELCRHFYENCVFLSAPCINADLERLCKTLKGT